MRAYKSEFMASARESEAHTLLCVFAICAETGAEAERLARPIDLRRLHMALGVDAPVPTYAEAAARKYDERETAYIRSQRARVVLGDPPAVRARLLELAEQYAADELMIITITGDYASRLRSYELIAEAFRLPAG
jgi:alkanesulfonate monooxygenase SsuD/methylene tetrahydromethanopterin reductase-like flavin-dependent oxidoreductase (luciferase family)